jgi:high-affinity iron transporter
LRKVWWGVAVALALCLAVGVLLQLFSASLPQREQEMLECVVAAVAVVMVSYMVLWMRAHSRDLRSSLQDAAGSALARGSAGALVAMAFLAVIREGFETAVFLLAAFQSAVSPLQAAVGVVLGVAVAVALGYLIYRGGVRLNLSRFFRVTGVVLVLVAAGLVMSTLRAAYEAGWLAAGQQQALDLSTLARPGSVQESLLTGMLGIRSSLPVVEIIAYLLYAVPMLLVVLWPPRRTPSRQNLGRLLVGGAVGGLALAALLVALAPPLPMPIAGTQGPFAVQGTTAGGTDVTGAAAVTLSGDGSAADISATLAGSPIAGRTSLTASGQVLTGTPIVTAADQTAAGLPTSLTAAEIAMLNGGRLPVGVRSGQAGQAAYDVGYTDTVTPTVTVDPASGVVVGVDLRLVRTVQVTVPSRGPVSAGTVLDASTSAVPDSLAAGLARVAATNDQRATHQLLAQVIPALLVVFAVVLLTFGVPKLLPRRRPDHLPVEPSPHDPRRAMQASGEAEPGLADAAAVARPPGRLTTPQ